MSTTYWLSRAGATQAEGPYTPRQIQTMWGNGQITAEDQLCPTDIDDGWVPAEMVIEELEDRMIAREVEAAAAAARPTVLAKKKRTTGNGGVGCLMLGAGLVLLAFFWPLGLLLIFAALILDQASVHYLCTACGNKTVRTARVCAVCRAHFKN